MPTPTTERGFWARVFKPIPDPPGTRRDIQGIRALAVLAVLVNHTLGTPTGGFAGVDVFFVVSGFLITGILLREYEKTGSISAARFYKRRIKRILPASTLVIVVTVGVSALLFLRSRTVEVATDGLWSLLFAANWRFAFSGTDYFAQGSGVSPLQHYWSLAVEEQFYFVWPWLLLALLLLIHRGLHSRPLTTRKVATVLIGLVIVTSLAWAWFETRANPTVAYFSTWTRAWELGVGAILATTASWWARLPDAIRPVLSWFGLVGAVASMALITETSPFPFPWAVLPVGFSALMLVAGIGREPRHVPLLTNRVSQFFGEISYSLYLWHFPVAIFGAALLPSHWVVKVGLMGIGVIFATGSFFLFEGPLHRSPWLSGQKGDAQRAAWARWRHDFRPSVRFFAPLTAVGVLASLIGCWAVVRISTGTTQVGGDVSRLPDIRVAGPAGAALQAQLRDAVAATTWPTLAPSLDDAFADRSPAEADGCLQATVLDPAGCIYGSGPKRALLVGDSYATASLPMVRAALEPAGYSVQVYGWYSCAVSTAPLAWPSQPRYERDCAQAHSALPGLVEQVKPDLLLILDSEVAWEGVAKGAPGDAAPAWSAGRDAMLRQLTPHAARTELLTANPVGRDINRCATLFSGPRDCEALISHTFVEKYLADADVAARLGVGFVDTRSLFSVDGTVPAFAGGATQRFDNGHLTATYGRVAAAGLREELLA